MRSTRTRLRAAITAGVALSAIGVLSLSSATVAELRDSIDVTAQVGVAGVPYGIARTVSLGFDYTRIDGGRTVRDRSTSLESRIDARRNAPLETQKPWGYGESGIRVDSLNNDRGCTSSNLGNNSDRCPNSVAGSLVSASTGREPGAEKFDINFIDRNIDGLSSSSALLVHDIETSVSCNSDGTVSAGKPIANYWIGAQGGTQQKNSGWNPFPGDNQYKRVRQWMRSLSGQNQAMTVELQSIRQTFSNPPRAISAIAVYSTSSDSQNGSNVRGDFAFVSKSECAVSADGAVDLDPSTAFGAAVPAVRRLETPGWGGSYTSTLSEGPVAAPQQRSFTANPLQISDAGHLSAIDPLSFPSETDEIDTTGPTTAPQGPTSPSMHTITATTVPRAAGTPAQTSPVTTSTQTTASSGPSSATATSPTAANSYKTPDDQEYSPADGSTLTITQRALVEQAIADAATADSGELPRGASYAVTANQLDGTTLIVTTADGGTLRIVWEK